MMRKDAPAFQTHNLMPRQKLRVCIDARIINANAGGLQQTVIGMAMGLSQNARRDQEYYFLTYSDDYAWLEPYLTGPCKHFPSELSAPSISHGTSSRSLLRRAVDWVRPLAGSRAFPVPKAEARVLAGNFDVVQFLRQRAFLIDCPTIYHPQDVQHRHLPQHFSRITWHGREHQYRRMCSVAAKVIAMNHWTKKDLCDAYDIPVSKVEVVYWPPPLEAYRQPDAAALTAVRSSLSLPAEFAFFPAKTFRHKNHVRLLSALAKLRDEQGLNVPLVLSGGTGEAHGDLLAAIERHGLSGQVTHVGFVDTETLACLYHLARSVVFPTEFEGFGLPLMEAFFAKVPVACSGVTCLPEVAGDAAVFFDPYSVESIADGILSVWTNEAERSRLIQAGKERLIGHSWKNVGHRFAEMYDSLTERN